MFHMNMSSESESEYNPIPSIEATHTWCVSLSRSKSGWYPYPYSVSFSPAVNYMCLYSYLPFCHHNQNNIPCSTVQQLSLLNIYRGCFTSNMFVYNVHIGYHCPQQKCLIYTNFLCIKVQIAIET